MASTPPVPPAPPRISSASAAALDRRTGGSHCHGHSVSAGNHGRAALVPPGHLVRSLLAAADYPMGVIKLLEYQRAHTVECGRVALAREEFFLIMLIVCGLIATQAARLDWKSCAITWIWGTTISHSSATLTAMTISWRRTFPPAPACRSPTITERSM